MEDVAHHVEQEVKKMTITPSLCNLPNELAINIFNRVGFKSVQNLRKVCHDLRIRIDVIKPEVKFSYVHIDVTDYKIRFMYQSKIQNWIVEQSEVEYEKTVESGRSIVKSDGSEKIVNGDFMKLASRDLQLILKFQKKSLESISFYNGTKYSKNYRQFLENLKSFLALENQRLKVDYFGIRTLDRKTMITALSLIDPQSNNTITLDNWKENNKPIDIAEIMEMELWKTAKRFLCYFRITGVSAHNFCHFSHIDVHFRSISAEYLLDLKKIFQNSSEAVRFDIRYKTFKHRKQFLEKMGPSVTLEDEDEDRLMWFFRKSTTDDDVMRIGLESRKITFRREAVADVPVFAMIQN